eukprot:scaffold76368_cov70-Phaeocystis_antarctica.AAC.2
MKSPHTPQASRSECEREVSAGGCPCACVTCLWLQYLKTSVINFKRNRNPSPVPGDDDARRSRPSYSAVPGDDDVTAPLVYP